MKNPATFTFDSLLPDINRYDDIIDVRSPSEFAEDHIPGAINCPVLSDEQRCEVGTLYKVAGSFEAKKIGAAYAAQNIAGQITTMFRAKPKEWRPLVYCWRGGNRSGAMAHIFAKVGWSVTQLEGGYKNYRRHVIGELEELPEQILFRVICGPTGSGKSRLLGIFAEQGAQVLDLEKLANHRGSVLGNFPNERQPTQKTFESALWETLRRLDRNRVVFVECESKKIGNVHLPDGLVNRMRASPCIVLRSSTKDRVRLLMQEYPHLVSDRKALADGLKRLIPFYGHQTIEHWNGLAASNKIDELVGMLLEKHYDPAYSASIARNFSQLYMGHVVELKDCSTESFFEVAKLLSTVDVLV